MSHRIDFKTLKAGANFRAVLDRYGLGPQSSRPQHFIICPFHREKTPSCRIDHVRNRFRCFGCGTKGSILDFVAQLERCSISQAAHTVATCYVADWGVIRTGDADAISESASHRSSTSRDGVANPPLGFSLQLERSHPYLPTRGLTPEIIDRFGLGFCDRGVMYGRIAIPIHDEEGRLIAYAGRWAAKEAPKDQPRYLLPRGFRKQLVLFNLHRVSGIRTVALVESFWSVFRLSNLMAPAVGLMGRELFPDHVRLLRIAGVERVQVMLDGDQPGRSAAAKIVPELARHMFVKNLELPNGMKPHSAPEELLRSLLGIPE
jgi:DNA primase